MSQAEMNVHLPEPSLSQPEAAGAGSGNRRAQHTPAPWFIHLKNNYGSQGTSVWARGGDVRVANCDSGAVSLEGKRADARLIAAAPELLAACVEFVRKCDAGTARSEKSYAQMTAAIAKALGEAA